MARYKDKVSAGHSEIVPYKHGEDPRTRHSRRLSENSAHVPEMKASIESMGYSLEIKNFGHHWIFKKGSNTTWEWWPSSAKLVLNKQYRKGIHCHDFRQVLKVLSERN